MQQKFQDIDSLQALIGMDQQAFVERFCIQANQIRSGATFERLENLVEIHNLELGQVWFYFRNGKLLAIDWTDEAVLKQIDGKALIERFGKDGAWMRSRAGKSHNLRAWPEKGIAVSLAGAECDYIHLFKPMPQQEYENSFYKDPGAFVR